MRSEAYTSAAHAGNSVDVLLNGDQIFPAALEAIRSARKTITYAQYFYEEGPIGVEVAEALAERCRAGVQTHILLDGFGTPDPSAVPRLDDERRLRGGHLSTVESARPPQPLRLREGQQPQSSPHPRRRWPRRIHRRSGRQPEVVG